VGDIDLAWIGLFLGFTGIGALVSVVVRFIQRAGGGLG